MTRIIHFAKDDKEQIYISDDVNLETADVIPNGWELISDETYDIDMPSNFPNDSWFEKRF